MNTAQTNLENFLEKNNIKNNQNILIEVDFEQLEICVAAFLSGDPVLTKEIQDGTDLHADNQKRFGLPTRLVAKTFVFRLLYGGSAHRYANDPDFTSVSTKRSFWQSAIDAFYDKYQGIRSWHSRLIKEVENNHGWYASPFGREFLFRKTQYNDYPPTDIKNYIVQGTGADVISFSRILLSKMEDTSSFSFLGTVHDSNLYLVRKEQAAVFLLRILDSYKQLPLFISQTFPERLWNLPCRCKVQVGLTWGNMEVIHKG